jgi:hypothetical protein
MKMTGTRAIEMITVFVDTLLALGRSIYDTPREALIKGYGKDTGVNDGDVNGMRLNSIQIDD